MEKVSLIKWREITLDMQKQTFLIKNPSQHSLFLFFLFIKPYLSPKHWWCLELAWAVVQVVFALMSPEVIVPGVPCCVWHFTTECCDPLPTGLPSRAAGLLFWGLGELGKLRASWAGWAMERELEMFSGIVWAGENKCLCQKRVVKILNKYYDFEWT